MVCRAVEADPTLDAAINNLAYLTAHAEPIDLDEALSLANRAVELVQTIPIIAKHAARFRSYESSGKRRSTTGSRCEWHADEMGNPSVAGHGL